MIPVAIIGGGPAGLMAAEQLLESGIAVELYDAMPTVGRKLLLAGIGGLNITHSEPHSAFLRRYEASQRQLQPLLDAFDAHALRDWVHALGIDTFVGSSGRVFPTEMKAAPLLRRWLSRLRTQGLVLHTRHRCEAVQVSSASAQTGYELLFNTPDGQRRRQARAVIFAMGGGSWARLGSDGAWQHWLAPLALAMQPLKPANCGFHASHSATVQALAGSPLKNITLRMAGSSHVRRGEAVITRWGIEGSLIYAHSAMIREQIMASGHADIVLDLLPDQSASSLLAQLQRGRSHAGTGSQRASKQSLSRQWQSIGLAGIKASLLRDALAKTLWSDAERVVATIKALTLRLTQARPLDEAISTAGGICWSELAQSLGSRRYPGLFFAGEMIDWEAPTGGYLLTACFATGRQAGLSARAFLTDDLRLSSTQGYN